MSLSSILKGIDTLAKISDVVCPVRKPEMPRMQELQTIANGSDAQMEALFKAEKIGDPELIMKVQNRIDNNIFSFNDLFENYNYRHSK